MAFSSKFAGFLRGLVGRAEDRAPARAVAPASSAPVPVSATPAAKISTPVAAPAMPVRASRSTNLDEIELPLAPVVAGLPLDLKAKLVAGAHGDKLIRLQAELVIGQLAFGAVKISFGELRQLAPGVFVNSGGELDNKPVSLPLSEILTRLNPALLARRSARKVEVASEITGPFADRGKGFTFTTQPLKAPAAPPPPTPAPAPTPEAEPPIAFVPPAGIRQVSPAPATPAIPQRSITPAAPTIGTNGNGNGHSHPLPVSPLSPPRSVTPAVPSASTTNGENGNHSNGHGNGNGHGQPLPSGLKLGPMNGNGHADLPSPTKMSAAPAPAPATPPPAPAQPTIFAALGNLCEHWPDELKNEIIGSPLAKANVSLDGAIVFPGLKRGRVTMTWKQLRILAQPSSAASPHDQLELELPLKVIAPLFLAAQKGSAKPQMKASVSAEIPDLFFGFPQPAAAPVPVPVTPIAPAAPVVPVAPLPKPELKPQDTNFYVWGEKGEVPQADEALLRRGEIPQTDFMSRQAHPKEVVLRAAALPGVVGAVVAMQDGLRVASQAPAEFNPDTLAAFLPQIFDRLNQSTRELRMGALNNINFTVGNVPWKIFRVNAVYFAVFGRAGEQLPSAQLAQLAAELDRKKQ